MPGVQGLQGRLPGERRHGDVQGRVPLALLRGAAAAARRVCHRASIHWWARLASHRAGLVNCADARAAAVGALASGSAACRTARDVPRFAAETFVDWFAQRRRGAERRRHAQATRVILWPDTFNNHFHPDDRASPRSRCSKRPASACMFRGSRLCCGRPLYDYGLLDLAKRHAAADPRRAARRTSRPARRSSCSSRAALAVFRDELARPVPRRRGRAARSTQQTFLLSEFLAKRRRTIAAAEARAQRASCTATAITRRSSKLDDEEAVLRDMGLDTRCSTPAAAAWPARSASRRPLRRLDEGRRARAAARGARARRRHADRRRRLQLPRADRAGHGAAALHLAEVLAPGNGRVL